MCPADIPCSQHSSAVSRGDGRMCWEKNSDGASLREEVTGPDCLITKNQPEMGLERARRIIHHILLQYPILRMDSNVNFLIEGAIEAPSLLHWLEAWVEGEPLFYPGLGAGDESSGRPAGESVRRRVGILL